MELIGYFDNNLNIEKEYRGVPHLGDWKAFLNWNRKWEAEEKPFFLVSIGPGHGKVRQTIHNDLKHCGLKPLVAIHRSAFVAENAVLGEGTQVYANATICVEATIGKACIINTCASVDHECVIEDGATIGPGAVLAGLVTVGTNADIYAGAVILPRLTIGEDAIVGAGAVVLKDVPPGVVVVGNPARPINKKK